MICPFGLNAPGLPWYEIGAISVVLPLIVVVGIGQQSSGGLGRWMGALSYPLYVLHIPVLLYDSSAVRQTLLPRLGHPPGRRHQRRRGHTVFSPDPPVLRRAGAARPVGSDHAASS